MIKNWIKYNESKSNVDIIDDLNDILLDLNDQGFNCSAKNFEPPPVIKNNIPKGYKLVRTHDVINIHFYKKTAFYFNDIKETYYRIKSYLTDNGYLEDSDVDLNKRFMLPGEIKGAGGLLSTGVTFTKELF